jgi:hypothetical protein
MRLMKEILLVDHLKELVLQGALLNREVEPLCQVEVNPTLDLSEVRDQDPQDPGVSTP